MTGSPISFTNHGHAGGNGMDITENGKAGKEFNFNIVSIKCCTNGWSKVLNIKCIFIINK